MAPRLCSAQRATSLFHYLGFNWRLYRAQRVPGGLDHPQVRGAAQATTARQRRLWNVDPEATDTINVRDSSPGRRRDFDSGDSLQGVTALYQAHALGLIRLAVIMLGDRPTAEDVVQDAFAGLYRRWHALTDTGKALSYVRSSVLNGARSALRQRARQPASPGDPAAESAEAAALLSEEHREVLAAIRRLPDRQREALVLRYYLELDEEDIAQSMGISRGTVKSTTSRAIAALRKTLGDQA